MDYPQRIKNLIKIFTNFPTVGHKTAERYVFYLLKKDKEFLKDFSETLIDIRKGLKLCKNCNALTDKELCEICSDKTRNANQVCVVANFRDLIQIESTMNYKGHYHVLGGLINAIEDVGPKDINLESLIKKTEKKQITEIILALSPNMEGETTSLYITKKLKDANIKITKLARGLSTGSEIEYADDITLTNAFENRNEVK